MERSPKTLADAVHLLQVCELLASSTSAVVDEWLKESKDGTPGVLPSQRLHDAQRTILAITGSLTELVSEPHSRVIEVACQYWESRALSIAAERKIPDLLAVGGDKGMSAKELGAATGIEHRPKGHSYDVDETSFQEAVGTNKVRWDWLEEEVSQEELRARGIGYPGVPAADELFEGLAEGSLVRRPEHETFSLAMIGGGRVYGAAHPYDYPWEALGEATIVDVGGGIGGFDMQLSRLYPKLKFVIQDRGPTVKHAKDVIWPKEAPAALAEGRVTFIEHDFFSPNPFHGAEVYWLRYIMHDWSDNYCIKILSAIRTAMSPHSRILICDQVMNTTDGCAELKPAPAPLPANYGYYTRYSHQRDLCMMGILNGIERTPLQFKALIEAAGMRLERIWECRSQVSILEVGLKAGGQEENGAMNGMDGDAPRTNGLF
ncbi:MAG: hypothetical protein Q9164_000517 [Protoblastenia rupestris]